MVKVDSNKLIIFLDSDPAGVEPRALHATSLSSLSCKADLCGGSLWLRASFLPPSPRDKIQTSVTTGIRRG